MLGVLQAFIAPVLRLGHWEAQEKSTLVYLALFSTQTDRQNQNHQCFFPHPLNLAYYIVCRGRRGDNLAQLAVMASKTQPQILPKERDSFFSSL